MLRPAQLLIFGTLSFAPAAGSAALPNPVLFVTQVPVPGDDVAARSVTSSFANHLPTTAAAPRGGDLMLWTNGTLRSLTAEAGYGSTGAAGFQNQSSIAVRDPAVHWSGAKAVFSMVVGAPITPNGAENYLWQLYEVTHFTAGQAPAMITKVPNQPPFNNIEPTYLSDGSIVFVSDRPRVNQSQLYPILDEYRGQEANSGLWRLDPASGALTLLEHTPSGSFHPFVDQAGRLLFTRWDHLMQDNNNNPLNATPQYSAFDWASEAANAATQTALDIYPEPINEPPGSDLNQFEINQFFPWQVNQDGTREEILNHLGRHELSLGINKTFAKDNNLAVFQASTSGRVNPNSIYNCHEMREDMRPAKAGRILCVDSQEFGTHVSGQIVAINAPLGANAHDITVQYITSRATALPFTASGNIGHFRDPLSMSDGTLVAAFSPTPLAEPGPAGAPATYAFRLTTLSANDAANGDAINTAQLTSGISRNISYYAGANLISYSGNLWEIEPVEVSARSAPTAQVEPPLAAPEVAAFAAAGVNENDIRAFLKTQGLALLVMRNVTSRDAADRQQPYNLHVAVSGGTTTLGNAGQLYDIAEMQFFEADQVRGLTNSAPANAIPGRRTITRYLNDAQAVRFNPSAAVNPGAQPIAADGSVALFVPARRAMTWTSLAPAASATNPAWAVPNAPVVRERYWIEYQAGEIRACDGCHGVNVVNQAGNPPATNTPQALISLLDYWKLNDDRVFKDGFGP